MVQYLFLLLLFGFFAIAISESNELVLLGCLIGFFLILAALLFFMKSEKHASFFLDKRFMTINSNNKHDLYHVEDIINLSEEQVTKNGKKVKVITVSYLDDNKRQKKASYELEFEVPENFVDIANKMINEFKTKDVKELYNDLYGNKEIEAIFLGKTRYSKELKFNTKKDTNLIFMSDNYCPLFFELKKSSIDVDNLETYKRYKVKLGKGDKYLFTESEDINNKIDIYKVNQLKEDVEKLGDEIIYDIDEIIEEIKLERKKRLFF